MGGEGPRGDGRGGLKGTFFQRVLKVVLESDFILEAGRTNGDESGGMT